MNAYLKWLYLHAYQPVKCGLSPRAVRFALTEVKVLLTYRERRALYRYAKQIRDGTIVEIGAYNGGSTYFLCAGARVGRATVVAIDPFDEALEQQKGMEDPAFVATGEACATYYATKPRRQDVEAFLRSQGFTRFELCAGFSHQVVRNWQRPIALLFVDGNHGYAAVRRDFREWSPFVQPGGYVLFHDSGPTSPWEGPKRLVAEISRSPEWELVETADTLTVFRRPA